VGRSVGPAFAALAGGAAVAVWSGLRARRAEGRRARAGEVAAERLVEQGRLEERERVAREVHDTIAQELAGIAMLARAADVALQGAPVRPETARERLQALHETTMLAIGHAHDLTAGAAVSELSRGGLVAALEMYVALCGRHMVAARQLLEMAGRDRLGIARAPEVELRVVGARRRLELSVESAVLWAMREGIANALRHAEADRVTLELRYGSDRLRAAVSDDGRGLPPGVAAGVGGGTGLGLAGVARRVAELGGRLEIASRSGSTTLAIEFPYSTPLAVKSARRFV